MAPPSFRSFEGRKFMWDGATYAAEPEALRAAEGYREAGFDVRVVKDDDAWLVFNRRDAAAEAAKG